MADRVCCLEEEVCWSTLPDDLIRRIGDVFLSTDDLDFYIVYRRACGTWRRATEVRFMPRRWIDLERSIQLPDEAKFTFLNLSTGRCVQKDFTKLIRRWLLDYTIRYEFCLFYSVRVNIFST